MIRELQNQISQEFDFRLEATSLRGVAAQLHKGVPHIEGSSYLSHHLTPRTTEGDSFIRGADRSLWFADVMLALYSA